MNFSVFHGEFRNLNFSYNNSIKRIFIGFRIYLSISYVRVMLKCSHELMSNIVPEIAVWDECNNPMTECSRNFHSNLILLLNLIKYKISTPHLYIRFINLRNPLLWRTPCDIRDHFRNFFDTLFQFFIFSHLFDWSINLTFLFHSSLIISGI